MSPGAARMPGTLRRVLHVIHGRAREDAEVGVKDVVGLGTVLQIETMPDRFVADVAQQRDHSCVACSVIQRVIESHIERVFHVGIPGTCRAMWKCTG